MIVKAARHTARVSYFVVGALLIVVALFTIAARIGLPLVADYKSTIESRVSDYLKSPVEVGELTVRWQGAGPMLHASDVAVLQTAERALRFDELLIDINLASSLLRGIPVINELSLAGASLVVETDASGQVSLHGIEALSAGSGDATEQGAVSGADGVDMLAWLFNARKVGLLNTELTVIDLETNQQITFDDLNVRAENDGRQHRLRVDASLPARLGGRLEAGVDLIGTPGSMSASEGNWYLSAESFNIGGLSALMSLGGVPDAGSLAAYNVDAEASFEMWGRWEGGQLISARGPLTLATVTDTTTGDILLDSASAQFQLTNNTLATGVLFTDMAMSLGGDQFNLDEFRLERSEIMAFPVPERVPSEDIEHTEPALLASHPSDRLWQLGIKGAQVPLELSAQLASIVLSHSQPALAADLRQADISGELGDFVLNVSGTAEQPLITVSGEVKALSVRNMHSTPAFGPLTGSIRVENSMGELRLSSRQMPFGWSAVNDEQLQIDSLSATVDLDLRDFKRLLIGADIQLSDDGIDTSTRISTTLVEGESPHLDVQSRFDIADISRIYPWLPRKQLPTVTAWVERALMSGKATNGTLLMFGKLADFPFEDGEGVFRASVDVVDGEVSFLSSWPVVKGINGQLELNGLTLTGKAASGALDQFNATDAQVGIQNLAAPVLDFSITADGRFQDLANFAATGPLQGLLEPAIGDISGTGDTQMDLALTLPLFNRSANSDSEIRLQTWEPFNIEGSVFLKDNDITFGRAGLLLDNAAGAVGFTHRGIAINNVSGKLLDQDVRLTGGTQGQGDSATTIITLKGALEANDLLAHYGNPLDQFVRGTSHWNIEIEAPHSFKRIAEEGVRLNVSSDLAGSRLLLPAPFDKGAAEEVPLQISTAFRDDSGNQQWTVRYGEKLHARVKLDSNVFHSMLIELGQIDDFVEDELAMLQGIRVQGTVPELAADGWIETIFRYIDSLSLSDGSGSEEVAVEPIMPVSMTLNTDQLILGNTAFGQSSIRANSDDVYLNLAVSNSALTGNLRYPREYWQRETALKVRIETMDWSVIDALSEASDEQGSTSSGSSSLDPRLLPRIEARVSMFTRDKLRLRDLVLRTEPNVSGLDVTTLGFAYDTMRLVGQGHWHLKDPQNVNAGLAGKHDSQLNLVLQSDDFGVGFEELGLNNVIADAQGTVELKVNWPGPLYAPEISEIDGSARVDVESGSIIPFEPGAGRVVGLFALQALPRRLNLDFKDLTHDGLAFKSIAGSAEIKNGIANVPLLQLTGPIGVVDIMGTSNLDSQEFEQQVTVLPRVSAALPIIGAISGGASAGIGALVAAGLLKALGVDFDRIGLRTYSLTGPWRDPVLTPIAADFIQQR